MRTTRKSRKSLIGACAAGLFGAAALTGIATSPAAAQEAPQAKAPKAPTFEGTVALSNCSGSVVKMPNSKPEDPALVMSNGHCLEEGMPGAGEVIVDQPTNRSFTLLKADGSDAGQISSEKIAYATMTDTDVSLYEATSTYKEIEDKFGIKALELDAQHPTKGNAITVVSGYWKETYSCAAEDFVHQLKEGDWTWKDSIRYTADCKIKGGTSGSPVVDDASGKVVGVNNTMNESGEECTMNNPCEVDESGKVTVRQGIGYGQQTYLIAPCVAEGNKIDLGREGCALPKP